MTLDELLADKGYPEFQYRKRYEITCDEVRAQPDEKHRAVSIPQAV